MSDEKIKGDCSKKVFDKSITLSVILSVAKNLIFTQFLNEEIPRLYSLMMTR
jgi:hypothetical protein